MGNYAREKRLDRVLVKKMASFARGVAADSLGRTCRVFLHQPKEPKDLAERLRVMNEQ